MISYHNTTLGCSPHRVLLVFRQFSIPPRQKYQKKKFEVHGHHRIGFSVRCRFLSQQKVVSQVSKPFERSERGETQKWKLLTDHFQSDAWFRNRKAHDL